MHCYKAVNSPEKTPCDHALTFFDKYYSPMYGTQWPSVRLALLSLSKHCAVLNNFSLLKDTNSYFMDIGAYDFVKQASLESKLNPKVQILGASLNSHQTRKNLQATADDQNVNQTVTQNDLDMEKSLLSENNRTKEDDFFTFMPVKRIVSERDNLRRMEEDQNIYRETKDFNVITLSDWTPTLPSHLHAYTFDCGEIATFKPAKKDIGGLLNYYLMDAASLLPVLALDLTPKCSVLDMCAAPGGKSIAMLQTLLPDTITCIDNSRGRITRLKDVLSLYIPKSYMTNEKVTVLHGCAIHFGHESNGKLVYDRVLVDVPCFADRHALHNEENNIFKPLRLQERLQIQNTQRDLLVAGILACKPGGSIVYSTCTLSMAQNDGVVKQALEHLWLTSSVSVAVVDTEPLCTTFSDVFKFYKCQFGQLVLPNLTANFGPIYFCKLQRLS